MLIEAHSDVMVNNTTTITTVALLLELFIAILVPITIYLFFKHTRRARIHGPMLKLYSDT